ncbi:unnamed protein product [Cylicocyclus nassatus]|uniref:RNA polymerase II subunit B1 CTD phosphatase RPAP2 homolog n=1 Tax=Cylicocyclus nassatus TaxID=53992 RepID=A0AA36GU69_CYLNA|nr:unnamed protein product [Cylicocyclus nassatus]
MDVLLSSPTASTADQDVQLTAIQLELIKEANSPPPPKDAHAAAVVKDAALRRAVHDTIVQLSEIVSENSLRSLLPFLHCGAWDELVEERYLGNPRLCGFPLCGEVIEARMRKQRYHIDRVARKIYEHRIETDMYCSRFCLMRSASVRAQLPEEPLWLSGDFSERLTSCYRIDGPEELEKPEKKEIEIVSAEQQKLNELKIREADSSTESETEDNDESETDVKGFLDEVADIIGAEDLEKNRKEVKVNISSKSTPKTSPAAKRDNPSDTKISPKITSRKSLDSAGNTVKPSPESPIISSPSSIASSGKTASKTPEHAYNPRLPDPQMAEDVTFTTDELEKIARLRSKYSKDWCKKKPILVEPVPASPTSPKKASEENASKTDHSMEAGTSTKSCAEPHFSPAVPHLVEDVRALLRGWATERTRQLLRSGGLSVSGEVDSLMKQFYRPYSDDVAEMNDRVLPDVDSIDVRRKRLHIFLESIKKQMTAYQRELAVPSSETNWHYMIAATFDLEPNTITDFSSNVLKLTCCVLLRLISLLDTSVEDTIYPGGKPSDKLVQLLTELDVDTRLFDSLISEVVSEEKA